MKSHKKLFLLSASIILIGTSLNVYAQNDETMTISYVNGAEADAFAIDGVSRITFVGDSMVVQTADGEHAVAIADVDKIKFDIVVSSVDAIKADLGEDVVIEAGGGIVNITQVDGEMLNVAVYNMQGQLVKTIAAPQQVSLDLTGYNPGVYIIKANNKVIKFRK
jgi:hypothetical protein